MNHLSEAAAAMMKPRGPGGAVPLTAVMSSVQADMTAT